MVLPPNSRLGSFDVIGPLGSGGMGEVYRARDARLGREVALKILPALLASDPERVARFDREARLLAALDHPHIAAVHGLEQADSLRFLVLELVPGETLAERLARGAIDLRQSLTLCRQVAEALEDAHAKGIIHRDLKPANIKVTPEGRAKVLDFGLAKALDDDAPAASFEDSPTRAHGSTGAGVILGTAGYMSPEQARGHVVDKRTDIWSFGCVLYEMLSGRRLFTGPSGSDVLAAVLTKEPDWSALPATSPQLIRSLLRRCLEKDRERRLHDIADARLEIEEVLAEPSGISAPAPDRRAPRAGRDVALVLFGVLLGALGSQLARHPAPTNQRNRAHLNISLPPDTPLQSDLGLGAFLLALSSDGQRFAFVGRRSDGRGQIFIRKMDALAPEPVGGTEEGTLPFFSPDGEFLGFWADGKIRKVPLAGGTPIAICDAADPRGASWGPDNTILLAPNNGGGLFRVSAAGGKLEPAAQLDRKLQEDSLRWPRFLPGGKAALISMQSMSGRESERTIDVLSLDTGRRRTLVRGGSTPEYAGGYLFFGRGGEVLAAPFDLDRLELRGEPRPVLQDVRMDPKGSGLVYFEIARDGTVIYLPGFPKPEDRSLVFMDRQGHATPAIASKRAFSDPSISPNGRRVAVVIGGAEDALWVADLQADTMERLTSAGDVFGPRWSADGTRIFFQSNAKGAKGLFVVAADGSSQPEELFRKDEWWINQNAPHPDGRGVMLAAQTPSGHDLLFLPDGSKEPQPFVVTPADENQPAFSPDGRLLAYASQESGRGGLFLRTFPGSGPRRQVTPLESQAPHWRRAGKELFFFQGARLTSVSVQTGSDPQLGKPQVLFEVPIAIGDLGYDVTPDGQHFLMVKPERTAESQIQIVVIPDFLEELRSSLASTHP